MLLTQQYAFGVWHLLPVQYLFMHRNGTTVGIAIRNPCQSSSNVRPITRNPIKVALNKVSSSIVLPNAGLSGEVIYFLALWVCLP